LLGDGELAVGAAFGIDLLLWALVGWSSRPPLRFSA
jgi:hypothetical protein